MVIDVTTDEPGPWRPASHGDTGEDDVSDEERLEQYLRRRAADGEYYFKSKFIAPEVGLSPSQIGQLVARLQDKLSDVEIEKWSETTATTWRIRPRTDT